VVDVLDLPMFPMSETVEHHCIYLQCLLYDVSDYKVFTKTYSVLFVHFLFCLQNNY